MASTAHTASLPENRLGPLAGMIWRPAAVGGGLLLVISALLPLIPAFGLTWERFFRSYLFAFELVLSLSLGALFFVVLQHCVKAGWSVVVRRIAEAVAGNLMWLWVCFIPVAIGMKSDLLYSWTHLPAEQATAAKYQYYLTPWFWLIRAAVFLFVWAMIARFFVRTSIAQDATGDYGLSRLLEDGAPLVAVGLQQLLPAPALDRRR